MTLVWSSLSDEELLVYVEQGNADACRAAAERLQEIVNTGHYRVDEIEDARDAGRQELADDLYDDYSVLLDDLSGDDSPLDQEQRQKLLNLRKRIVGNL